MSVPWQASAGPAAEGAIYDRGYRHYQGPREGRSRIIRAILWAGVRRALGLKRPWRTKIIPFGLLLLAMVPAVVWVGVRVILGDAADEAEFLGYPQFYGAVQTAMLLFAATAAPELLCPERRQRVVTLIFTRPVRVLDYLAGKFGALVLLMGLTALVPLLLVYAGNALAAPSAPVYVRDNLADLGRILATGVALTLYYGLTAMAVASLTDRRSIASASFLGLFLVSTALANMLFFSGTMSGRRWLLLFSLVEVPGNFVGWMFGQQPTPGSAADLAGFPGGTWLAAMAVASAVGAAVTAWRMRKVTA